MPSSLATIWLPFSRALFGSPAYDRLNNALREFEIRLAWREKNEATFSGSVKEWDSAARESLVEAKEARKSGDLDRAWQCLHIGQSMEIWGQSDNEIIINRKVLCGQKRKFGGWRGDTIAKLVCDDDKNVQSGTADTLRQELYQATLIANEQFNNLYHKVRVRGKNLKFAFLMLALIVLGLLVSAKAGVSWGTLGDWKTILAYELTGAFGACLSVAIALTRSSIDATIPQQVLGSVVTWMRPLIGAAAAVVAVQLLQAELLPVTVKIGSNPSAVYFVIAFLAGFSERFIVGALEKMLPEK